MDARAKMVCAFGVKVLAVSVLLLVGIFNIQIAFDDGRGGDINLFGFALSASVQSVHAAPKCGPIICIPNGDAPNYGCARTQSGSCSGPDCGC